MSENLIAKEDAVNNLLACAAYIAERLKSADGRADAMQHIVPLYIARGDVDAAAALADAVEDPLTRDRLLVSVADKCGEVEDYEYGFQLAEAIEDFSMQSAARERIAFHKIRKGDIESAELISTRLDHPDNVLLAAAVSAFEKGDSKTAFDMVEKVQFPYARCTGLQALAASAFRKGDKSAASEMLERAASEAREIDFPEERIRARVDIAHSFVDAERNDRAIVVLDEAKTHADSLDSVQRGMFLADVAVGFLRAGSLDFADRTLDLVNDKTAIVSALSGFAGEFLRKGENQEALEAVKEAIAIVRSQTEKETRDHPTKFRQWRSLAVQLASLGEGEGGIETALGIPDEGERTTALSQLHVLFTERGDAELAQKALVEIKDSLEWAFAVLGAADVDIREGRKEAASGKIAQALSVLGEIDQPVAKSSLMTEGVRRFIAIGDHEKARECGLENLRVIAEILDESIRSTSLAVLAGVYEAAKFDASSEEGEVLRSMTGRL